ncbi:sensor histidine kinase [Streptomyces tirandamycinicus]|uniref:sensor histidine kinase n=1 Tax=Streptomyces tirandamycinicus TaxID=2174846 RepID=UPI00226E0616|nr:HAMP domain-containing sensor histidine kinase [Streptomyces tirandamycinicus]MCY0980474.1 HAMP domain-containing sensor histidine kinase [Streptomyces tirandamycinicus]
MSSVRAKAALGATLVVAVALIGAGLTVLFVLRASLTDQAGLQAEATARNVATQLDLGVPYDGLDLPDGEDHPVRVTAGDGRERAASEDLEAMTGTPDAPDGDENRPRFGNGTATVDGETADYRFAAVRADGSHGGTVTVTAGASLAAVHRAVDTVRDAMLIGLPALLAVVAGVTWLVTRRALRPVEAVRSEMAAITASEDLSRRVPEPDSRDEIARLARTTNETLASLEASVERQRRFVADASHELRSPIASLRTQLEVGAAHPGLLDVAGAVADTVRLQQLAADLLLLARLDAGERPGRTRLDLAETVREQVALRGAADRLPVAVEAGEPVAVAGSPGQLARALGNLLDNAQRHARRTVAVTVRREGRDAVLTVADDGPGVPEQERERVFERFVRLDDARTRDAGGAGLGLAIARDVARRHGGTLTVSAAAGGGALFVLRLPVAP